VSSHVIENDKVRWLFGWNQAQRSFFISKIDKTLKDEDNPVVQVGNRPREIPTAEGLVTLALMMGLRLPHEVMLQLGKDKDMETNSYFVLFYADEFVQGFETDSLGQAELLQEALVNARPGEELHIRRVQRRVA
jgi:hypothetical protein